MGNTLIYFQCKLTRFRGRLWIQFELLRSLSVNSFAWYLIAEVWRKEKREITLRMENGFNLWMSANINISQRACREWLGRHKKMGSPLNHSKNAISYPNSNAKKPQISVQSVLGHFTDYVSCEKVLIEAKYFSCNMRRQTRGILDTSIKRSQPHCMMFVNLGQTL